MCPCIRVRGVGDRDHVNIISQLGHGGQHKYDGGEDNYAHGGEGIYLEKVKILQVNNDMHRITLANKEVSGYSVRFQHHFLTLPRDEDPKSSSLNLFTKDLSISF